MEYVCVFVGEGREGRKERVVYASDEEVCCSFVLYNLESFPLDQFFILNVTHDDDVTFELA